MRASYRLTILGIFMLVCCHISAQDLVYKNFSIDDGLPSSEVYHSLQDSEGYMWFATDHGVCRYDGKEFRTYTTVEGLEDNVVFKIVRDRKNRIWFMPQKSGLSYYQNGSIRKYRYNHLLQELIYSKNNLITDLYVDKDDNVWFTSRSWVDSSNNSLFCINSKGVLKAYNTNTQKYPFHYFFLKEIDDGYVAAMYLLQHPNRDSANIPLKYRYDSKNKIHSICRFDFDGLVKWMKTTSHLYISYMDKFGQAWLRSIDFKTQQVEAFPFEGQISALFVEDSTLYIGTESGLKISTLHKLRRSKPDTYLKNIFISNIGKDHEGNVWITSLNNGIYSIYQSKLLNIVNDKDKLYSITFLRQINGRIYYGTSNQKLYELIKGEPHLLVDFSGSGVIIRRNISDLASVNGTLMLSNLSYSQNQGKRWSHSQKLEQYSSNRQFFIKKFLDINDTLICCLNTGLAILYKDQVLFHSDHINFNKKVTSACSGKDRRSIYLGTIDGIYEFNLNSKKIRDIQLKSLAGEMLKLSVSDILFRNEHLYIASKEEGLIIYSLAKNAIVAQYRDEFRTPTINCLSIDSNFLWAGTNKGLFIASLDKEHKASKFEYYNKSDGLPSNEITHILIHQQTAYISSKTEIFFCPLYSINKVTAEAPLIIDSFIVNDKRYPITETYAELNPDENNISIPLTGIFFRTNNNFRYKYSVFRDNNNIIPGTNIFEDNIRLIDLKPGKYDIYVWSTNKEGISSKPKLIRFSIAKPFTQTASFVGSVALAAAIVIILLIRLYLNSKTEKERRNRLVLVAEQKALRAQMNPHFIFNALNSIQYYIASKDHLTGANFLSKFSKLIRSILENSSKGYITLSEELDNLKLYLQLEKLRFEDDFTINLSVNVQSDPSYIRIPSMMIQPFIENSIWHGLLPKSGEKSITIAIEETVDSLRCSILDNGIGREASKQLNTTRRTGHQSQGLTNIEERIRLYNAAFNVKMGLNINDLTDAEGNCVGTEVLLTIPLLDPKS